MKLRLQKGSVRFRLSSEEIKTLKEVGELFESVELTPSGQGISYLLTVNEMSNAVRLHYNKDVIQILIPAQQLEQWLASGEVGIRETLDFGHHENLSVIIEKDLLPKEKKKNSLS